MVKFNVAPEDLTVKIARGLPGKTVDVATLTNPDTLGTGNLTFTASGTVLLDPSTQYWVVVTGTAGDLTRTNSTDQDGGQAGWSIADDFHHRSPGSTGPWSSFPVAAQIRVNGTPNPGTAPSAPAAPSATTTGIEERDAGLEPAHRPRLGGQHRRLPAALLRRHRRPDQRERLGHRGRGGRPARPRRQHDG